MEVRPRRRDEHCANGRGVSCAGAAAAGERGRDGDGAERQFHAIRCGHYPELTVPEIAGKVADGFAEAVRENEERWLSPLAVRSYETRGREKPEEECRIRTPFQRDRDRIIHSKAFRRLRFKTQVFIDPEGDHFRTRLT